MYNRTFFSDSVDGVNCKITSKMWSFGGYHHIPTHAVSDVEARSHFPLLGLLLCFIAAVAIIAYGVENNEAGEFYLFLIVPLIITIILLLNASKCVIVTSKGSRRVVVSAKGRHRGEVDALYAAMLACIVEGDEEENLETPAQS